MPTGHTDPHSNACRFREPDADSYAKFVAQLYVDPASVHRHAFTFTDANGDDSWSVWHAHRNTGPHPYLDDAPDRHR